VTYHHHTYIRKIYWRAYDAYIMFMCEGANLSNSYENIRVICYQIKALCL